MLTTIIWVPGAIGKGLDVNLPAWAPNIDLVSSAEITRVPTGLGTDPHTQAAVVAALLAHPQADIVDALAAHTQAEVVATLLAHPQADIVAALVDHPQANIAGALAAHTLNTQQFGGVTNNLGHDATPDLETAAAGNVTIAGCISAHAGAGADVPHDLGGAAFAHVGSGTDIAHANGANPVAHVAGAAPLVHAGGADPVVAAVPTKVDRDTFSLSAALLVGDILRLSYIEEGGRMVP